MSRRCSVCSHPDSADIDAQLVEGGGSNRDLARKYCLSEDSLSRHRRNHLPKIEIQAAADEREYGHHQKLKLLEKTLFMVLTRRLREEDDGMVLRVHGQLLRHYAFELQLGEVEEIRKDLEDLRREIERREIDR